MDLEANFKSRSRYRCFGMGVRGRSLDPELFDLLSLLKTNLQHYIELLHKHNRVNLEDQSMGLRNAIKWFEATPG
jgi:hypothetical protein